MTKKGRLGLILVVALLLGAVSVVGSPRPAVGQSALELVGHGYGHGRGMGQYGALGYAVDHGWDHGRILNHFYGGTAAGTIGNIPMSVLLMGNEGRDTIVFHERGRLYTTADDGLPGGRVPHTALLIRRAGNGVFQVFDGPGCGGPWTPRSSPVSASAIAVYPGVASEDLAEMLQLCQPSGRRWYRGNLWVTDSGGVQHTVNALDNEGYLQGVVPRESPASWGDLGAGRGINALRAQAVAARSFAAAENRWSYAKTCDTVQCQVYGGRAELVSGVFRDLEDPRTNRAVAETAGLVRMRSGAVARTEFSSSTGGYSAGGTFPAVPDDGDDISVNPNHRWVAQIPYSVLEARYGLGAFQSLEVTQRNGLGDLGGRALSVRLRFARGDVVRTGDQVRSDLGLRSNWFAVATGPPTCAGEVPGYLLDGYGGLHPRGGAAPATGGPYWGGWDIARDAARRPGTSSGWVLDGYGGVHPFNGAPGVAVSGYWPGWDIAKALTASPSGPGGWVLDGYGGVHPFGGAPPVAVSGYWAGWNIARDLMANPTGPGGWVLDGYGGVHPFGGAPPVAVSAYWAGWDIARKLIPNPTGSGGWVLDGYGGLHPFGGAPPAAPTPGYPLHPARDAAVNSGSGHVVTGHGQVGVLGTACVTHPLWPGWDIARAFAPVG